MDNDQIWNDTLESIRVQVSPAIYSTWFTQTHLASVNNSGNRVVVEIGCNSSFVKSTIESRYFGVIQDALSQLLEKPCDIIFIIKQKESMQNNKTDNAPLFEEKKTSEEDMVFALKKARIRSGFRFENYAVSTSNQMAWAAAEAVSDSPGSAYNPLFIWGGVGVGKTHLMNAVAYSVLKKDIDKNILFVTGEEFTNDIVEGIRSKTTSAFRNKYRRLDVLLVDDIQFIAGKDAVQEEFFHTFNALVGAGGQVILTSDRTPSEISKLEERLRSRFEAGLIVDVSAPDFELRCAITQIKSKERGLVIPMDLIQIIAGNMDSARKIEGFLIKLVSEAKLKNSEIDKTLIESIIGKGTEVADAPIKSNPNDVISAVVKYFSIGKRGLMGTSRARPIALPRQILMYLLRTELQLPLQEVGRLVGGRDHTTVMHAVDKISTMLSENVQIRADIRGIKNML
jgi:chromosomal replication initiator protein